MFGVSKEKDLGVRKNVPRVLAYSSHKIPWIDEFVNALAYRKQNSGVAYPAWGQHGMNPGFVIKQNECGTE